MKSNRELAEEIVENTIDSHFCNFEFNNETQGEYFLKELTESFINKLTALLDQKDKQAAILVDALEEECEIAKTVILKACLLLGREATATISDKGFCYGERWQNATTNYERIRQKARLTLAKYKEGD